MSRHSNRKASGYFEVTGIAGELRRGDTLSCCHCGTMWVVAPGSGITRGYCVPCMKYTCGNPACDPCVPYERRLENIEAGRPELTPTPALIAVPNLSDVIR